MLYRCEQCEGHIEIDEDVSGVETVGCPHCGFETRLIPVITLNEPSATPPQPVEEPVPTTKIKEPAISAKETEEKPIYSLEGCGLSYLEVYDDRVAIIGGGIISGGSIKTIPFSSITAVQLKQAGLGRGSLRFTIPGGSEGQGGVMVSSDGEFFVGATGGSNSSTFSNGLFLEDNKDDLALKIKTYIEKRIRELRTDPKGTSSTSLSDELTKLANLKNQRALSEEEFQAAKKLLLNT